MQISPFNLIEPILPRLLPHRIDNNITNLRKLIFYSTTDKTFPKLFLDLQTFVKMNERAYWVKSVLDYQQAITEKLNLIKPTLKALRCALLMVEFSELTMPLDTRFSKSELARVVDYHAELSLYITEKEIGLLYANDFYETSKLIARYNQLFAFNLHISDEELMSLANAINLTFAHHNCLRSAYYKKNDDAAPFSNSPFTQQICPQNKYITVILKKHGPLQVTGSLKKCCGGLNVPFDTQLVPQYVGQTTNKTTEYLAQLNQNPSYEIIMKILSESQFDYEAVKNDINIHRYFVGLPGIWPLYNSVKYTKVVGNQKIPKLSFISPLATGSVYDITVLNKFTLTLFGRLELAYQISQGVQSMHNERWIHGDLKDGNCLFLYVNNSSVRAGLIDFGFAHHIDRTLLPFPLGGGVYGSIIQTAPELLGNKNFGGDLLKVEIWALGFLFHQLFLDSKPCWAPLLKVLQPYKIDPKIVSEMRYKVLWTIEPERAALVKKTTLSLEEECRLLVCDLLRFDPKLRPDINLVLDRLEKLKSRVPPNNKGFHT